MRIRILTYLAFAITIVLVNISCKTGQEVVSAKNISDKELREKLFEKDSIPFDFFYSKIGIDFTARGSSAEFSSTIKMRVDSAFSGTLKKMVIIGTYLVDQDSIRFADKLKKCYILEDMTFISSVLGTAIEYKEFQALMLGLPVGLDKDVKYVQIKAKDHYILSSHKKKDYKKLEQDKLDEEGYDDIFIQYHMAPETFDLTRINIKVPADTVEIDIRYIERKLIDEKYWVPEETSITVYHPRDTVIIEYNYGTVRINDPKRIRINIPESYEECGAE